MKKIKRKSFRHLDLNDRDRIALLKEEGYLQKDIASVLGCNPATISRELARRKTNGTYDSKRAQEKYRNNRRFSKRQGMKVEDNKELRSYVIAMLKENRSPDEIAGRMKLEKCPFYASREAIYKWLYSVWGQRYVEYLCTKRSGRKRRKVPRSKRTMISNRVHISSRPLGATNKTRYGHWEADTAVTPKRFGSKDSISVSTERKSKLMIATKIKDLKPDSMTRGIATMHNGIKTLSISLDNGGENRDHGNWGLKTYFADPHSPWQKPHVENNIGLLRRWRFPKKQTDWAKVSEEELQEGILFINEKYRKSLNYRSANEVALSHGIM